MTVNSIPTGYTAITPYIMVTDGVSALDFYTRAFEAKEIMRMTAPDGSIMHAEIEIDGARIMISSGNPDIGARGPEFLGGVSGMIMYYCEDVDAAFARVLNAGGKSICAPEAYFWGDKMGTIRDPFGQIWSLATHIRDVSEEEMEKGQEEFIAQMAKKPSGI